MELSAGATIAGRYSLRCMVGEGGMGSVWQAEGDDGEVVALKFVHEARASSAKMRRRLIREAKAACTVSHPSVVQVHDIVELEDGAPVMVMEFLHGETLAQKLDREGEIALAELAPLMQHVVSAVGTAHASGVIHRDLKPENIFLTETSEGTLPKILDFGIAKLAPANPSEHSTELTKTGAMMGTPCYMAPEQVYGERDIDARADIWALGVIMYRALSGLLPTKADNVGQVMKIITVRGIWPLSQAVADAPDDIAELVDRMLMRERDERVASLHEVRDVLARYTDVETPDFGPPASAMVDLASSAGGAASESPPSAAARDRRSDEPKASSRPQARRGISRPLLAALAVPLLGAGAWAFSSLASESGEPAGSPQPSPVAENEDVGERAADTAPVDERNAARTETPAAAEASADTPSSDDESGPLAATAPVAAPRPIAKTGPSEAAEGGGPAAKTDTPAPTGAATAGSPEGSGKGIPGEHGRVVEDPPF